jgi:hypothetical protein
LHAHVRVCSLRIIIFKCFIYLCVQGYYGCAVGKAKQAAKTEIEKLKLADMTCKDLVKEAARM